MIRSMTGFGKAQATLPDKKLSIELRSLNSKQFDLTLKIPSFLREKESELRAFLSKEMERGKAECYISLESGVDKPVAINRELFKFYYNELLAISRDVKADTEGIFRIAATMPDVIRPEKDELDPEYWIIIYSAMELAAENFIQFRENEGRTIETDLNERLAGIQTGLDDIAELDANRVERIKERISNRLRDLAADQQFDPNRLELEMVYYVEKLDINEEKVRLSAHLQYFHDILEEPTSQGRKLGFIAQEMGREINTIGSKANDAAIQQIVVRMKDELEKIKEQLNNVL